MTHQISDDERDARNDAWQAEEFRTSYVVTDRLAEIEADISALKIRQQTAWGLRDRLLAQGLTRKAEAAERQALGFASELYILRCEQEGLEFCQRIEED